MFRLINAESKTIIGAATIVGLFSFFSRVFGFIRDRILAGTFGAGDTLDVYYAAFKIPDLMFSLMVVGALSASFIPIFTNKYFRSSHESAWNFTSTVLNLTGIALALLTITLIIFSHPLAQVIAPGFSVAKQQTVSDFMRIMLVAQILLGLSMVLGSALQSLKRFFLYASAPILYNIGIIIGAVWFVRFLGPIGLAWGVVLGAALHLLMQWLGCFGTGYVYRPLINFRSSDVRELLSLTGPRILGIAVNQILFIVLAMIATTMSAGSVTIFQFAYNIQFFPVGIVGVSLAIAAFPTFCAHLEDHDLDGARQAFSSTVRQALFFLIPVTVLFLILRAQMVRVVVGAGAFDWTSTILTADTLAFFVLTLIPQSLVFILARMFFALHDTLTPLTAGLIGALSGLLSAFVFKQSFGVVGLGIAYSVYAVVNLILLWVPLRKRLGSLDEARIMTSFMKLFVAGMVCAVVTQLLKPALSMVFPLSSFVGVFMQGGVAGFVGLIVFGFIASLLKSEELRAFLNAIQRRLLKKAKPLEPITMSEQ
ncbi:murein biosynthesis integral membrane protein MurJ [Candidatus Uhrbacteria bacterium]|nr:murein biosynthesis integral membrane protein MurJ [Candidatus Uhrbacteria bacterium]